MVGQVADIVEYEVGDGFEVEGGLVFSEAAVEVGADADMVGVACELADVIHVVHDVGNLDAGFFGSGHTADPAGGHHPGVEGGTAD